ncbi:MAG: 3D domain-containing protein [Acidobacteria bacterium]|nr:3D domain-containing protein [Acidobacteriota bacterium]
MLLARSFWWKALVWAIAAGVFVSLAGVTIFDARYVTLPLTFIEPGFDPTAPPAPGARLAFTATAYCKGIVTSSGVVAQRGMTAADPALLPAGSIVQLDFKEDRWDGIYTVVDTGPEVQGREIDLYMWNCDEAQRFGRRSVRMTVLRLGWNPHATTKSFFERLRAKPEPVEQDPLPARPLPVIPVPPQMPPATDSER